MLFQDFAAKLSEKNMHGNKPRMGSMLHELYSGLNAEEIQYSIYLCQGRLGPPYAKRRLDPTNPSKEILLQRFLAWRGKFPDAIGEDRQKVEQRQWSVKQVYVRLHALNPKDSSLRISKSIVFRLRDMIASMNGSELECLAGLICGPLVEDKDLIGALARLDSLVSAKIINEAYSRTWPDLGLIAALLKTGNSDEKIFYAKPRLGTPVPPEVLPKWGVSKEELERIKEHGLWDLDEVWGQAGKAECYVQAKFDGEHVQIHKSGKN